MSAVATSAEMNATPNGRVIRFPVERVREDEKPALIIAWYRCHGGCGRLVSSPLSYCLACCVEDAG